MEKVESVKICPLELGAGMPKIGVPITGKSISEILKQVKKACSKKPDLLEWRLDFFDDVEDFNQIKAAFKQISTNNDDLPLLITFRTKSEGGERQFTAPHYFLLLKEVLNNLSVNAIDLELFHEQANLRSIVSLAHQKGVKVVMSNHDFEKTPAKNELISRLTKMFELGADVAKIAVMPNSSGDVLTLLSATSEAKSQLAKPIITMSMGELGKISRVSGQLFGSSLTFASVDETSAPGQVPIDELRKMLQELAITK